MKTVERIENTVGKTNSWRSRGVRFVAVQCPKCEAGGGHPIYSYQPKCYQCKDDTLMQPCWHSGITGDWDEAVTYFKELDNRLGNEIKC